MEAPQVQIDTTMGSFTVELYHKHAPRTVDNFRQLAQKGYYDGTIVSGPEKLLSLQKLISGMPLTPCARSRSSIASSVTL